MWGITRGWALVPGEANSQPSVCGRHMGSQQVMPKSWLCLPTHSHHTILISKWLLLLCYIEGKDQAAAYKSSPGSQGWWLFPDGLADEASCHLPLLRRLGSPSYFWPTSFYAKLSWLEVITKVMLKQVLKTGLCPTPWRCPTSAQYGAISRTSC